MHFTMAQLHFEEYELQLPRIEMHFFSVSMIMQRGFLAVLIILGMKLILILYDRVS